MFDAGFFNDKGYKVTPPGAQVITLIDITYADLIAQLAIGSMQPAFYNVTSRPSSGTTNLTVEVLTNGNACNSMAIIQRLKPSRGSILVKNNTGRAGTFTPTVNGVALSSSPIAFNGISTKGSQYIKYSPGITGITANGLTNGVTYTASVDVDGATNNLSFLSAASNSTFSDLVNEINLQLTGAIATISGGGILIISSSTGASSTIAITDVDLFSSCANYNSIQPATPGVDAETPTQIATNIVASCDNANYTYFSIGPTVYIDSLEANGASSNGYVLALTNDSGDTLVKTLTNMSGGGIFDHDCNYNLAGDFILWETDTFGNSFYSSGNRYLFFPFDNTNCQFNENGRSGYFNMGNFVGQMNQVNTFNNSRIFAVSCNAQLTGINLFNRTSLDVTACIANQQIGNCQINLPSKTLYLNSAQSNLEVSLERSNYSQIFTVATDTISFGEDNFHNWAGIVTPQGSVTLNTINDGDFSPRFIEIRAEAGEVVIVDPLTATNIILAAHSLAISISGNSALYLEKVDDGLGGWNFIECIPFIEY